MLRWFKRLAARALRSARRAWALVSVVAAFGVPAPLPFTPEPWSSLRSPTRESFVAANVAGAW